MREYLETTERSAQKTAAKLNGDHTAENLEPLWARLDDEEKLFIEYLYLSGKRMAVALYEDELFSGLLTKGMLQTPPGVGTLFMHCLRTTYSIPIAVWQSLHDRPDLFFSLDTKIQVRHLEELTRYFKGRIDTLLKGAVPVSNK